MKKRSHRSLFTTIIIYIVGGILFTGLIVGYLWVESEYSDFQLSSISIKNQLIEDNKDTIYTEVDQLENDIYFMMERTEIILKENIKEKTLEAYTIANNIYTQYQGSLSDEDISNIIREVLRNVRFNRGRGYYFIDTLEGDVILYPILPESEGSNIYNLQDHLGNYVIQDEINLVKEHTEGYVEAYWIKNTHSDGLYKKISYIKYFEPLDFYIGTGEYLVDVEIDIKESFVNKVLQYNYGKEADDYMFIQTFALQEIASGETAQNYSHYNNYQDYKPRYIQDTQLRQLIVATSDAKRGYIKHIWRDPATQTFYNKLTYVCAISEWNWIIGTGINLDDIDTIIDANEIVLAASVRTKITHIIVSMIFVMIVAIILSFTFIRKAKKNFDIFQDFLNKSSLNNEAIDINKVNYFEFASLAVSTNNMLLSKNIYEDKINQMNKVLKNNLEDYKLKTVELTTLVELDFLTQLLNRKTWIEKANTILSEIANNEQTCNMCYIIIFDIDHFKRVNDTYGHLVGDEVIKTVSKIIKSECDPYGYVGRYGGEEFVVVISNIDTEACLVLANKIREIISQTNYSKKQLKVTISAGVSSSSCNANLDELIELADKNLYIAKENGRNRIVI